MHISKFYENKEFVLSFEIAPPRNGEDINKVYNCVEDLIKFKPSFFTVTQGSGGSLRGGTAAIASELKRRFNVEAVSHITCLDKSKKVIENELILNHYLGIENIMALRGDPPWGEKEFIPADDGFRFAYEFVEEIQKKNNGQYILRKNDWKFFKLDKDAKYRSGVKTNFCVSVAGYPEGHRECKDINKDILYLKQKVDSGSDLIFTQILYDPKYYFDFISKCTTAGINIPIIPGIMTITFLGQIDFIKNVCSVEIPELYVFDLKNAGKNKEKIYEISVEFIAKICNKLIDKGIPGLHFYTLNNAKIIKRIIEKINIPTQ